MDAGGPRAHKQTNCEKAKGIHQNDRWPDDPIARWRDHSIIHISLKRMLNHNQLAVETGIVVDNLLPIIAYVESRMIERWV